MHRTVECKLYPTEAQAKTLGDWLRSACWVYNRALEQRIKAYQRRGTPFSFYDQCKTLTGWRERIARLKDAPKDALRDALRRVDRGMHAFFRRCKAGEKPGFPRFRSHQRYNSLEFLESGSYVRPGNMIHVPKLGLIKFRGGNQQIPGEQRLLRMIRRASGWYCQVLIDDGKAPPEPKPVESSVGVDVGLLSFATLSTGESIENPRWARSSQRQLAHAQRRVSRRRKGSVNRRKAIKRLQRVHEKIAARRRDFCHQLSRRLVNENDLIGVENLIFRGLARARNARSVMDAAWAQFIAQLVYKAEYAGKRVVAVDPRHTSQECPDCGARAPKELSERVHRCHCGCTLDRDVAASRVILARALGVAGADARGGNVSLDDAHDRSAVPLKREVLNRRKRLV